MGGQSLFASPLDLWKERRLSASTCGSFMTHSPASTTGSHDIESVYTSRSSVSSMRSRDRTRSRSLASHVDSRLSLPVFEEGDERLSMPTNAVVPVGDEAAPLPSPPAKMFTSYNVRVWKQTPHATWMNVFVPRHVRLQTGSHPFIEYSRQENGVIRQRVYLTTATKVDRLPKNKLQIEFKNTDAAVSVDVKQAKQWIEDEAVVATPKTTSCNTDKWVLRFETKQERDQWAKRLQDTIDLLAWISKFTVGQVLIESGASTLAECYSWLDQGQPSFIMKAMATSTKNLIATARQEIRIHHLLTNFSSHPNVLALHDSFRQQERAYLVLEYCSGGDLFEHIHKEGALDETTAKALFRRIADAIAYIHEQNVVHLDIKPENLLFQSSPMNPETIKLADFGSAQLLADPSGLIKSTVSCTIGYAAPEVLDSGDVSFAADVFSAGAVLYTMLCGFAPFQSPSDEESMERTLRGEFSFDDPEWVGVSAQAKDLICGMLEVDPRERLSMEEVLGHPWLK